MHQGPSERARLKLGHSTGEAHLNVVHLEPGGVLGAHQAPTPQLFIVTEGQAGSPAATDGSEMSRSAMPSSGNKGNRTDQGATAG